MFALLGAAHVDISANIASKLPPNGQPGTLSDSVVHMQTRELLLENIITVLKGESWSEAAFRGSYQLVNENPLLFLRVSNDTDDINERHGNINSEVIISGVFVLNQFAVTILNAADEDNAWKKALRMPATNPKGRIGSSGLSNFISTPGPGQAAVMSHMRENTAKETAALPFLRALNNNHALLLELSGPTGDPLKDL